MSQVHIYTFQRSGSHFLEFCLKESTDLFVTKSHPIADDKPPRPVITIVRDPMESISSILSIKYKFNKDLLTKKILSKPCLDVDSINQFIYSYELIMKKAKIYIKYNDLSKINLVTKAIAENLGSQWYPLDTPELQYQEYGKNNIMDWKFNSSRLSDNYQDIYDRLSSYDLSECYRLYNESLKKCIIL